MFNQQPRFPPEIEYPDTPYLESNRDSVERRTIHAGWHALFTHDVTELSFLQLAKDVGVSYTALYRYFPSVAALAARLVCCVFETLEVQLIDSDQWIRAITPAKRKDVARVAILRYVHFVAQRPRHFGLAISGQFSARFPEVAAAHERHLAEIRNIAELWAGRAPNSREMSEFRGILFAAARLGAQRVDDARVLGRVARCFGAEPVSAARAAAFTAAMKSFAGGNSFTTFTSTNLGFFPVQTPTFACALNAAIDATNEPSSSTKNGTFHLITSETDGTAE